MRQTRDIFVASILAYLATPARVLLVLVLAGVALRIVPGLISQSRRALRGFAAAIRCRFKVMPIGQWCVRRGHLRLLQTAFDREGGESADRTSGCSGRQRTHDGRPKEPACLKH